MEKDLKEHCDWRRKEEYEIEQWINVGKEIGRRNCKSTDIPSSIKIHFKKSEMCRDLLSSNLVSALCARGRRFTRQPQMKASLGVR